MSGFVSIMFANVWRPIGDVLRAVIQAWTRFWFTSAPTTPLEITRIGVGLALFINYALATPYLRPFYDEPEFVVRNVWRQFGGWWDGAASRLKPAPDAQLASELAELAGGADVLVGRAVDAADEGDFRLACHLADLAGWAAPADPAIHRRRAEIYEARARAEPSLMSQGIYRAAARDSAAIAAADQRP